MPSATTAPPESARAHYLLAALLAKRAVAEAQKVAGQGIAAVAAVLFRHQMVGAVMAERAVLEMLSEQDIDANPQALLNPPAFTTDAGVFEAMAEDAFDVDRLIESLVQDATRAAESVATAVIPDVHHVRYVSPPCCARCAILAGRVYRWSDGFLRHPQCDCVMIPTTVAAPFAQSPDRLFEDGQIRGLSKADTEAIRDGADVGQVVNVRSKAAGLKESGRVLARAGRPTPERIYRSADGDREFAVELLTRFGYVL